MKVTRRWPGLLVVFLAATVGAGFAVVRKEPVAASEPSEQLPAATGQTLTAAGVSALRSIVDGASNPELRWPNLAPSLHRGGVGYYAASNFVHVDVGRVRHW